MADDVVDGTYTGGAVSAAGSVLRRISLAFALLTFLVSIVGCGPPRTYVVRYVVPTGFRGHLAIVEAPGGASIECVGNTYVVEFPPSGILVVRSAEFETRWAERSWRYADGTPIPDDLGLASLGDDKVAAIALGSMSVNQQDTVFLDVIETKREHEAWTYDERERRKTEVYERALAAARASRDQAR